jgi:hypothetical protein
MKLIKNSIIGELVLALTNDGYRVELCDQDGGGLFLYAAPDSGFKPEDGWEYWVRLTPGNDVYLITDYSINLEDVLAPVFEYAKTLENL